MSRPAQQDDRHDVLDIRAAVSTAWQDAIELARRHRDLDGDPVYRVLLAELERLALPGVTSVSRRMQQAEAVRKAVAA